MMSIFYFSAFADHYKWLLHDSPFHYTTDSFQAAIPTTFVVDAQIDSLLNMSIYFLTLLLVGLSASYYFRQHTPTASWHH